MSDTQVTTSVIIPCHDAGRTLGLQLEALWRQQDAEPFEVVVVDNGSTDDTVAVARSWADRLDLRVVDAADRPGAAYARNRGVALCRGAKLLFCDGDDLVAPHFVAHGQRALEEVPVYVTAFIGVEEKVFRQGYDAVTDQLEEHDYCSPQEERQDQDWPVLPGGCFGIRRDLFLKVGGFDPSAEPGAEDNDLGIRCTDAGHLPPVLPSTMLAYRIQPAGDRSYALFRRRARSTALLLTSSGRWGRASLVQGPPVRVLLKTCLAVVRPLARRDRLAWREWRMRLARDAGLADGYLRYQVLHRTPRRRTGEGLSG